MYHNNKCFMFFFFSDKEKYRGGKTMVHCHAGISRSATICLAYIMYNENLDLNTAFEFVKSRKHEISPNLSFMGHNFSHIDTDTDTFIWSRFLKSAADIVPL